MPRILAIDYGGKRTGIAVTDPLQIIATGLTTIPTSTLLDFLKKYMLAEQVEKIIIGLPVNWDESDTHNTEPVRLFVKKLEKTFPLLPIETVDERNTSRMAKDAMFAMGMKKKDRRKKELVDEIAATIILQEYMQHYG